MDDYIGAPFLEGGQVGSVQIYAYELIQQCHLCNFLMEVTAQVGMKARGHRTIVMV